jgi:hypothetical protein
MSLVARLVVTRWHTQRGFDEHDVGTEIREESPGDTGDAVGQVDDTDPGERECGVRHRCLPLNGSSTAARA